MLRLFMPDTSNEAKLIDQVDSHINKVIELGFLRKMKSNTKESSKISQYEVKRIIRAYIDAQWLSEFDSKLAEYARVLSGEPATDTSDQSHDITTNGTDLNSNGDLTTAVKNTGSLF